MQLLQEIGHGKSHDYRAGSPHLKHWRLNQRLTAVLRQSITSVTDRGLPLTLLEIGAGHGGYTEPALAAGCEVTATETSRPSVERLRARFRSNPRFTAVFAENGSLDAIGDDKFSVILCASVLHHIPDYLSFITESLAHLSPGGAFLSVADPLWYPRLRTLDHFASRASYFAWRLTRGRYRQGLRTRIRRLQGVYDADDPADMVEYHVNRSGVDERAVADLLLPRFSTVSVVSYWSTQASVLQRLGEGLGLRNCFAVLADGFRG
jgi:SAM-dependent methyltransferase